MEHHNTSELILCDILRGRFLQENNSLPKSPQHSASEGQLQQCWHELAVTTCSYGKAPSSTDRRSSFKQFRSNIYIYIYIFDLYIYFSLFTVFSADTITVFFFFFLRTSDQLPSSKASKHNTLKQAQGGWNKYLVDFSQTSELEILFHHQHEGL